MSNFGNQILYQMCADYPKHDDIDVIAGKIWLIGHSYSASVNRVKDRSVFENYEDFILEKVAPQIKDSNIDEWLGNAKSIDYLTAENCETILDIHKKFTDILRVTTALDKRSLASKYLHFHLPNSVFIYDSLANNSITKFNNRQKHRIPEGYDDNYATFIKRCLNFRDEIFEEKLLKRKSKPRELDVYLLKYNQYLKNKDKKNLDFEVWQEDTVNFIQENQHHYAHKKHTLRAEIYKI